MNKYLTGNFGPVREEVTLTDLKVTGSIPQHLDGRYVRIGPNPVDEVDPMHYHWFMGDGMVHGVRIRDGKAEWYRNRWVRSDHVADALGERHRGGKSYLGIDFGANTNVVEVNGRTFAIVESGGTPYELTDELDSIGFCDFDGTLDGGYTAHPHRDPQTGEHHAVSYFFGWGSKLRYTVLGADAKIKKSVDIPVHGAPMVHDFALTKDYVVLYDLPVTFDSDAVVGAAPGPVKSLLSRVLGKYPIPEAVLSRAARGQQPKGYPYTWNPDYPARIGVLPRDGKAKDVQWFDVDPCYVFHTMNAFQQDDDIVVDVIRHPSMFTSDKTGPNHVRDGEPALYRWTVDRQDGKVREELIDDSPQEFPRFDERLTGHQHRYGYGVGIDPNNDGSFTTTSLLRHDLRERRTERRSLGAHRNASEFVFVPTGDDSAEDDGVLMGYVYDAERNLSDLEIVDAQTLETVATVHLPVRVPYGFHGNWLPTTA